MRYFSRSVSILDTTIGAQPKLYPPNLPRIARRTRSSFRVRFCVKIMPFDLQIICGESAFLFVHHKLSAGVFSDF